MVAAAGTPAAVPESIRPKEAPDRPGYAWPLDRRPELASSFGEYRPTRFHAGVDLRTNGVGLPVHSLDTGYVERVRCSPWGFGKAVYVRQNDGYTAVYAHLQGFEGELAAYVRKAQHAAQNYTVDLTPTPGSLPLQRGQVLARSGETGIGPPHLHLELRGADGCPINPRMAGLSWPDTDAPKIRGLLFAPVGEGSAIEGREIPCEMSVQAVGPDRHASQTLGACGRIAVGVDVMDPAPGGHRLGVYRLKLLAVDPATGQTSKHFRIQHDRVSYDDECNADLAYYPFLPKKRGAYFLLCRRPGNHCGSYAGNAGDGTIAVDGESLWRIEAEDFMGNTAALDVHIKPQSLAEAPGPETGASRPGTGRWSFYGDRMVFDAEFPGPEEEVPQLVFGSAENSQPMPMRRVDARRFALSLFPKDFGLYTLTVRYPGIQQIAEPMMVLRRGGPAQTFSLSGIRISVQPNTPYDWLPLRVESLEKAPNTPFPVLGKAVSVWPDAAPLDAPITLSLPLPEGAAPTNASQIYRLDGTQWTALDTTREPGWLTASSRHLGIFAAMEDAADPELRLIDPNPGTPIASKRPRIAISTEDRGSGLARVDLFVGEHWLLAAYDPEAHRTTWEADEDLPSGRQMLRAVGTDRAGRTVRMEWPLNIP